MLYRLGIWIPTAQLPEMSNYQTYNSIIQMAKLFEYQLLIQITSWITDFKSGIQVTKGIWTF